MVVKYSLWLIWLSYWVWAQVSCKAQWVVTPSHRTGVKILQKSWTPWNETYNRCLDVWVVLIPFSFRQLQKKYHSQATGQVHWKCLKWFVSNYVWGCVLYLPGDVIISSAVLQCHAEPHYTCKKKTKKTTCNSLITECRWDISISNLQSSTKKRREFSSFDTKNNFIV